MTRYLLLVTLGPVQEFIAQARRTRDLWYGSHLLSELSRAAAGELASRGARLIFPALEPGDPELKSCDGPLREGGTAPLGIPNKLLAEVDSGANPEALARAAREAAKAFLRTEAKRVRDRCDGLIAQRACEAWDEQVESFLEFFAAWAAFGDYAEALREVEAAVAGRKWLRDFRSWRKLRGGAPMSSLDGGRETVLRPAAERDSGLSRRYRIAEGEQLDAIGLIKRAGGRPDQFVSVVNVALASWSAAARKKLPERFAALEHACETAAIPRLRRDDIRCARAFPFDASVLLPGRWKSLFTELGTDDDAQACVREHVGPLLEEVGEPYPYVACLAADGDRMGEANRALGTAEKHREFSKHLGKFPREARRLVEQEHLGSLVYAGGDDVLAFLPVGEALACANELRVQFEELLSDALVARTPKPTLSVGIGLGHLMESMGELIRLAHEALRLAKEGQSEGVGAQRNALAVIVDKRSGKTRSWRARWDAWGGDPVRRLQEDIELLRSRLPARKVYEIACTLRVFPQCDVPEGPGWTRVLSLEVRRALYRVLAGEDVLEPSEAGLRLDASAGYGAARAEVSSWIDRMLVARTFAEATPTPRAEKGGYCP
ncbi:MAG: type III-B CRISPR-associated protein Cas10/Cmr2 [Planctomycetota bacterium]